MGTLSEALTAQAATISAEIRKKVQALLDKLQTPMNDIYRMIQGAGAKPIRLDLPGEDDSNQQRLNLLIDFAKNRTGVQPGGYLSDSQIHSVALALRMAAIKQFNAGAPIITLDDIVTSYDADHRRTIARFLLTSRTYIWRSAHRDLKTGAFPLFDKAQVVINVQGLATAEKAQILYNHIKRGDQPASFKKAIKPHLATLAEDASFLPETARRLGSAFFTEKVTPDEEGLLDFARRPVDFLKDVLRNLDRGEAAAVALIFMHGGQLASPIENDDRIALITELLGVTAAEIRLALDSLRGSLALLVDTTEGPKWTFKHPTIGDAYAALVANSPELTEIYLRGAKFERLLEEVVCGGVELRGASVRVGPSLYPALLNRLLVHPIDYRIRYFLGQRCDAAFLRLVVDQVPAVLDLRPGAFMAYSSENRLLAKLHQAKLLPEEKRLNETRDPDVEGRVETPVGRAASARSNIQSIFDDVDR